MDAKPVVYIVDNDVDSRESLATLIRLHQVGSVRGYDCAKNFLAEYEEDAEGCIILTPQLSDGSGLDLPNGRFGRRIVHPVIFLATRTDVCTAVQAMRAGAIDFLEKPFRAEVLIARVKEAIGQFRRHLERGDRDRELSVLLHELTDEERRVMEEIGSGTPNKQAASRMGVSLRTFHARRASLMKKCGVDSRAALVQLAATSASPSLPSSFVT